MAAPTLLAIVSLHAAPPASTIELTNAHVSASLSKAGELVGLAGHGLKPHNFTGDSWSIHVSSYNSSAGLKQLAPTGCPDAPRFDATDLPWRATFSYDCGVWLVDVTYALPPGGKHLSKGIAFMRSDSAPWAGTVASVTHWDGLELVGGAAAYTGFAARQPNSSEFHPANASDPKGRWLGFGTPAEWVGGFYRRAASNDGLFVTVANPFGAYAAAGGNGTGAAPPAVETVTVTPAAGVAASAAGVDARGKKPAPGPFVPLPTTVPLPPSVHARYEPLFLHSTRHEAQHVAECAYLGLTALQAYAVDSTTGINLGEHKAFTEMAETTLTDRGAGGAPRKPVRVQVGWDSNDYQIDIATAAGRAEYKRMIDRDSELGITHAIFAPQNTRQSRRSEATDEWGWEESLFFSLGPKIRKLEWSPSGPNTVPKEVQELLDYAAARRVKLLAYVYPVLPFMGDHAEPRNEDGWLYDGLRNIQTGAYIPDYNDHHAPGHYVEPNCTEPGTAHYSVCGRTRASLASPAFQEYFARVLIDFVNKTGAGGYAWDYTAFRDWRRKTDYDEWRGWHRILSMLRRAHPDIVMDHRQVTHGWGVFAQQSGSYSEPIGGDENPETYGAKGVSGVVTLSTDHILANNLRIVNYVYRGRQLLPNVRVPGFASHQTERQYPDGQGPGSKPTWNVTAHYRRDFDLHGFAYGLLSSIGTAGLNNVLAMLPARDPQEFARMPNATKAFARRWLDWTDAEYLSLHNTIPLAALDRGAKKHGGIPQLGHLDGTGSFLDDDSRGFLFLFNPGPRPVCETLVVDEGMGVSNASAGALFLAHEIYPREEVAGRRTPIGVWQHGEAVSLCVGAESAKVVRATKLAASGPGSLAAALPLVLNLSYVAAAQSAAGATGGAFNVTVTGAVALSGAATDLTVLGTKFAAPGGRIGSVLINGHLANGAAANATCGAYSSLTAKYDVACAPAHVKMAGDASLRAYGEATTTSPPASFVGGAKAWFNTSLVVTAALKRQMAAQQAGYNVSWDATDMDAPWLGNRLMLFPYITAPDINRTIPRVWLNGSELRLTQAFNSRGYKQVKCFLGWYYDASALPVGTHAVALQVPRLNASRLEGFFWRGVDDVWTGDVAA